jgi:hypothetical protein
LREHLPGQCHIQQHAWKQKQSEWENPHKRKQYWALNHAVKNLDVDCYIHGKEIHSILAPYKLLHDTAAGKRELGKGRDSFQLTEAASGSQTGPGNCVSYQVQLKATSYCVEQ